MTKGLFAQKSNSADTLASAFTNGTVGNSPAWPAITLASPDKVELAGTLGLSLQRSVQRLALAPYTTDWLLSDVSFKVKRIFTNYSGDVSGRFLELGVLTSPPGRLLPAATLPAALKSIVRYQKPDGHFGVDVDLTKPLKRGSPEITMLWGNARIQESDVPHYGSNLEKKTELWPTMLSWNFTPKGILIKGGNVGLIEGQGYEDYRFDFDLTLPKEIRRGETYHITTECRGNRIKVFVDEEEVYEQSDDGFHRGAVGFCVSAPLDQGLFENIRLQK